MSGCNFRKAAGYKKVKGASEALGNISERGVCESLFCKKYCN
jgi:hypothetical protein